LKEYVVDTPLFESNAIGEFVQRAVKYRSSVYVSSGDKTVNGKSVMGMISLLSVLNGEPLRIVAEGADENEAIKDLEDFSKKSF
jgi:phosphotransferase system HPr (HPr) family protein